MTGTIQASRTGEAGVNAPSPYSRRNQLGRLLWSVVYAVLFRPSPRTLHGWRAAILRLFGAKLGRNCHIYATARIWAPWNLICEDGVAVAEGAELYNPSPMYFGRNAIVSQGAYICGATHLYDDPAFTLVHFPMRFGAYSWVCARAIVSPGVNMGEGAILGLGSIGTRDMEPFGIYAGVPAKKIKERAREAVVSAAF